MFKKIKLFALACTLCCVAQAQETFPVNGVTDVRTGHFAFTNATIVQSSGSTLRDATMIIKDGKIISVGKTAALPTGAVVVDCKNKYIYPSFIEMQSDYGMPKDGKKREPFSWTAPVKLESAAKGALGWNEAIHSERSALAEFAVDEKGALPLLEAGFGTVLTHVDDGIAQGTSALVSLAGKNANFAVIKERMASHYSFNKGSSTQSYPSSLMGSIALLRQTYLDAQWYKNNAAAEGVNQSLKFWNDNLALPQIFDAGDKWNGLRADRIGDEFGVQYILIGGGNEYERINEIKNTKAAFILPIDFPKAMDVEDPNEARFINLQTLKAWEMAPTNPATMEKAGINFALSSANMKSPKEFWPNLRKAIFYGLSEQRALDALTKTPAELLKVYDITGSLEAGKLANFLITNGPLFDEKTLILQNWAKGEKHIIKDDETESMKAVYALSLSSAAENKNFLLDVMSNKAAKVIGNDTVSAKFSFDGTMIKIYFNDGKKATAGYRLSGISNGDTWQGNGVDSLGRQVLWSAKYLKKTEDKPDSTKPVYLPIKGNLTYPNMAYGLSNKPTTQDILIQNATVWTSEKEGVLEQTDVLVKNGKIAAVGKNLSANGAMVVNGTGKHLTPGIIDEHSHIATASVNEGGQTVTSEVRIADNIDPDDVNIYRQLSGGVTTSHILHGSANTIGGQTQLIKLRWGANDEELKFKGADPFIKFALGENVKRTTSRTNNRFPDTRMGVQQVQLDAFTRASDYQKALKGKNAASVRRDLELEALVEIMNAKRFITCHSYVQSEIVETMRIAEQFGFKVNTFTHILEGYKVADKMKAHGAAASTFSDWWAYKLEVQDAIAFNAAIMQKVGLNVAINSDDAEMARRLNQEAAKAVKYGGVSPENALNMVTINPAKMLHIDKQTGSIKVGKDADLVLWSDSPLSIYARAEKTLVDGIIYFDREKDLELRKEIQQERNRLLNRMLEDKKNGGKTEPAKPSTKKVNSCEDDHHAYGILDVDEHDGENK